MSDDAERIFEIGSPASRGACLPVDYALINQLVFAGSDAGPYLFVGMSRSHKGKTLGNATANLRASQIGDSLSFLNMRMF